LDAYNTDTFPCAGSTKRKVAFTTNELSEDLTILILLIAESNSKDKDKMVGVVMFCLENNLNKNL